MRLPYSMETKIEQVQLVCLDGSQQNNESLCGQFIWVDQNECQYDGDLKLTLSQIWENAGEYGFIYGEWLIWSFSFIINGG